MGYEQEFYEREYALVKAEIVKKEKEIRELVRDRRIEFFRMILSFLLIFVVYQLIQLIGNNIILRATFFEVLMCLFVLLMLMPLYFIWNLLKFLGGFGMPTFSRLNVGGLKYCYVREKQMREEELQKLYQKKSNLEQYMEKIRFGDTIN